MRTENTDLMFTFRIDSNIGVITLSINYIILNFYLDTESRNELHMEGKPIINFLKNLKRKKNVNCSGYTIERERFFNRRDGQGCYLVELEEMPLTWMLKIKSRWS